MGHISFDYSKALGFFNQEEIDQLQSTVIKKNLLVSKKQLKKFKKILKY